MRLCQTIPKCLSSYTWLLLWMTLSFTGFSLPLPVLALPGPHHGTNCLPVSWQRLEATSTQAEALPPPLPFPPTPPPPLIAFLPYLHLFSSHTFFLASSPTVVPCILYGCTYTLNTVAFYRELYHKTVQRDDCLFLMCKKRLERKALHELWKNFDFDF